MRHIKFTYVDAVTGIPVTDAPAKNGPAFPDIEGLEYEWAKESMYPTDVPLFFGTAPVDSFVLVPGVLDVLSEADYHLMYEDELRARIPSKITPAQGLIALYAIKGITDADVQAAIDAIEDDVQRYTVQIAYARATEWDRNSDSFAALTSLLGLTDADVCEMMKYAAGIRA